MNTLARPVAFVAALMLPLPLFALEKATLVAAGATLQLRAHSSAHANSNASKMQMLYVSGLENGCTSVYLYADNDAALYNLAAAVLAKSTLTLIYDLDLDKRGPWGGASLAH